MLPWNEFRKDKTWSNIYFNVGNSVIHVMLPTCQDSIGNKPEFKLFYQNILSNILHIPENKLVQLKSKLQNVCHKYKKIEVPYKHEHIIANLTNNKTIIILKQVNGSGVVIMDSSKCMGKCLGIPENDQFAKINNDPTKCIECKIQRCIWK